MNMLKALHLKNDMILNEISQAHNGECCVPFLICRINNNNNNNTKISIIKTQNGNY